MENQTGNQDFCAHQWLSLNSICRVSRDHVGSRGCDPFGNNVLLPFSAGMYQRRYSEGSVLSPLPAVMRPSHYVVKTVENLKCPSSFRIYETPLWVSVEAKRETWTAISNGSIGLQHLQSPSTDVVSEKKKKKPKQQLKGLQNIQPWCLKW